MRRFLEEVWNQQRLDVIDEVFAPTFLMNGEPVPRAAIRQLVADRRAAFPDVRVTVEDLIGEGDKVSTRRRWDATHHGTYRGITATGRRVSWRQVSIVRLADGRIVEDWLIADELSLLRQLLGQLPTT